ncbi:aromatic acid exporter family protein [Enterococcus hirae]|jgi:uncharacterized membrane protein YgaE (UPF0421/DUF939 family)|nr:aromatic acid exporter family protein [Enterococcaceae bacterium]MCI1918769.1 aromatic acid exporter family protein [Enterococcaceae bacterium]MDM8214138.1 aromatic acid exporter family protein [Enterococcus hirae]
MEIGSFRLGMRTIKTALAILICLLLFHLTDRGAATNACLAAVIAMREDFPASVSSGRSVILGNTLGGLMTFSYYLIDHYFFPGNQWNFVFLPFLVILLILLNLRLDNPLGIVSSVAAFLLITLNIPQNESFLFAVNRTLDTFIGAIIAILLNIATQPRAKKQKQAQLEADLRFIRDRERRLENAEKNLEEGVFMPEKPLPVVKPKPVRKHPFKF